MIEGMGTDREPAPPTVVAAIAAAVAATLGVEAGRYRVTAVRPLGWAPPTAAPADVWSLVGRQEAAFVRHHFGEGRRP
jgi:hypothetical protein